MAFHVPEDRRLTDHVLGSTEKDGNNGAFWLPSIKRGTFLFAVASDGLGWEHVSISVDGQKRCPIWEEMCQIKDIFWDPEDCVVQFHPPQGPKYVNTHPYTLHLWRSTQFDLEEILPDPKLVGIPKKS